MWALGGAPVTAWAADGGDALLQAIERAIGVARCNDDAQCRVAPIGASPCGGPESFRAWSTRETDGRALERLIERYAVARRLEHERSGLRAACMLLPVPGVGCARSAPDEGRCALLTAGPT